jgi:hypothetical protein
LLRLPAYPFQQSGQLLKLELVQLGCLLVAGQFGQLLKLAVLETDHISMCRATIRRKLELVQLGE